MMIPEDLNKNLEVKKSSQENVAKILEVKDEISTKIENVDKNITEITNLKNASIEKIERKKKELRELTNNIDIYKEKTEMEIELQLTEREIEERKVSITKLDETIASFDNQIAEIQCKHDKAVNELDQKKRKLNQQLKYYDKLNKKLTSLLELLESQSNLHGKKICELLKKRSELLKRPDLSENIRDTLLQKLDEEINTLNVEHEILIETINQKLSDSARTAEPELKTEVEEERVIEITEPVEMTGAYQEVKEFEIQMKQILHPPSEEKQIPLLDQGFRVTPSGHIITETYEAVTGKEAEILKLTDKIEQEEQIPLLDQGFRVAPSGHIITETYEAVTGKEAEILKLTDKIDKEGRIPLLDQGFRVTHSGHIITETYEAVTEKEAEAGSEWEEISETKLIFTPLSSAQSCSIESSLGSEDVAYLKEVFGKTLSLALAEICSVQPVDPIHYLAHWFLKYRYNQEIDEAKRREIQALLQERERIETERWHAELEKEAKIAIMEALFRAENIIMQQDFNRLALAQEEIGGEYEDPAKVSEGM